MDYCCRSGRGDLTTWPGSHFLKNGEDKARVRGGQAGPHGAKLTCMGTCSGRPSLYAEQSSRNGLSSNPGGKHEAESELSTADSSPQDSKMLGISSPAQSRSGFGHW